MKTNNFFMQRNIFACKRIIDIYAKNQANFSYICIVCKYRGAESKYCRIESKLQVCRISIPFAIVSKYSKLLGSILNNKIFNPVLINILFSPLVVICSLSDMSIN